MSYYVLTENTARGIKNILNNQISRPTSVQRYSPIASYKDSYPHPFEVRWTESMISGGGYAIWLPPECFYMDNMFVEPKDWIPYAEDFGKLHPNDEKDWWYRLSDKIHSQSGEVIDVDALSSFNLYMVGSGGMAYLSLSGQKSEETWAEKGVVLVTQVENYKSKPNVKSNLILNDTSYKPFDTLKDNEYQGAGNSLYMVNCIFEYCGKTEKVGNGRIIGPIHPKIDSEAAYYALRLVRFSKSTQEESEDTWGIDRIRINSLQMNEIIDALNKMEIEEIVSGHGLQQTKAKAVYPLYLQDRFGSIVCDLRHAWYNINVDSADEKSVALTGDALSNSIEQLSTEFHLNHFHDRDNDLSVGQILSGSNPPVWMVNDYDLLVRHRGQTNPNGKYANELHYLCLQDLVDNLSGSNISSDIPDKLSSMIPKADEKSVSLTGDILSNSVGKLSSEFHLKHFHDRENDLSVGQIVSGDKPPVWMVKDYDLLVRHRGQTSPTNNGYVNELFYICLQDLVDSLSGNNTSSDGGQDEIEPDQLSSIPVAGMFAWTESTKTIGPGGCMVGRQWYTCTNGIGSGKLDGLYQLKVTMHPDNATLVVVSDAPLGKAPTANQNSAETWIPIYQIVNGKIAADYRGAFVVPAYE